MTETSRELSEGWRRVRSSLRHARLFIRSFFSCSPVDSDCWMLRSSALIALASSILSPCPCSRNLVLTLQNIEIENILFSGFDYTYVCSVSTPLCLKSISELMLASSLLSLWTLALAWWTSDLRRSGSYLVLEAVELVEFTETKKNIILHSQPIIAITPNT